MSGFARPRKRAIKRERGIYIIYLYIVCNERETDVPADSTGDGSRLDAGGQVRPGDPARTRLDPDPASSALSPRSTEN